MKSVLRHFTRIDPRSLGLFRIWFGLALLLDLSGRMLDVTAFYSNDGVTPNHVHLFHLKAQGRFVWSALHAFNTPGEALFALVVIGVCYFFFMIGWKTRVFHALSLIGLLCLTARNLLIEGPGEPLALALLFTTVFLPLGSSFSLDAVVAKASSMRETRPSELSDPQAILSDEEVQQGRRPGWSPYSVAAFGTLALIAVFFLSLAKQQVGAAWQDGSALNNALHIYMFASPTGFALRDAATLGGLTHVIRTFQWIIPILLVVPILRTPARGVAAGSMVFIGLTYALLSNFTFFGLTIASAAALVIANDGWEKWAGQRDVRRARTVIFDVDCGICFWLSKLLRRYDSRNHLLIQGNDILESESEAPLSVWDQKSAATKKRSIPEGITRELVEQTIVVVRPDGSFVTHGAAVVEILRALPGFSLLGLFLSIPGISSVRDALYRTIAKNRTKISVEVGLNACGVATHAKPVPLKEPLSPFARNAYRVLTVCRELMAVVVVGAILSQATAANPVGFKLPQPAVFESLSWWSRTTAKWTLLTPEPAREHGGMIVDTATSQNTQSEVGKALAARGGSAQPRYFDSLNQGEAALSIDRPFRLGGRWALYLDKVQRDENRNFQTAFKTYLGKRGPRYEADKEGERVQGVDAYWVSGPTFPNPSEPPQARRLFRHGRGGTKLLEAFNAMGGTGASVIPGVRPREIRPEPELDEKEQYVPPRPLESPGQELE